MTVDDPYDYAAFFRRRCLENPEYLARNERLAARERERERELAELRALPKLLDAGVPGELARDVTKKPLFSTQCLARVMANDRRAITVLSGITGCGKSLAGAALIGKIGVGWFVSSSELAALDRKRVGDRQTFERALAAPCLVVDDLGTEPITSEWLATLDLLVDKRVGFGRATVITTNLRARASIEDERNGKRGFQRAYGPRIWSRLLGLGTGVYLESSDPDFRAARRAREALAR